MGLHNSLIQPLISPLFPVVFTRSLIETNKLLLSQCN
nr:MAG TPA: hypothetical protein [Caudoviricetes sp.]